jgi:hypothetical protein
MMMKNAGMTVCALLVLVSASGGTDNPPKKFRTNSPHPHHSLAQTGGAGHARSSGPSVLQSKSQSAHEKEVERLEHQNATHLQAQSRQRNAKAAGQVPHNHSEPTRHSSSINFGYHPPHTQSTGAAGARKH